MGRFLILILGCIGFLLMGCQSSENPSAPPAATATVTQGPSNSVVPENDVPPSPAVASPAALWPPNQKMVTVVFTGFVMTPGHYTLTDEYGEFAYSGTLPPGNYTVNLDLLAMRNGSDKNGRYYTFTVTTSGGSTSTNVICPHSGGN